MKLLTVRDAALWLACSQALVYELCAQRRIKHVRLGLGRGTIRIEENELETFLQDCKVNPNKDRRGLKHIRVKK